MFIDIIITSFNKYKYHSMLTSKGVIYFLGIIFLLFILVDFNLLQKLKYEVDNSSKLRTSLHKMLKLLLTSRDSFNDSIRNTVVKETLQVLKWQPDEMQLQKETSEGSIY